MIFKGPSNSIQSRIPWFIALAGKTESKGVKRERLHLHKSLLWGGKKPLSWISKPKRISTQSKTDSVHYYCYEVPARDHSSSASDICYQNTKYKDDTRTLLAGSVEEQLLLVATENSSHSPFLPCNFTYPLPVVGITGFPVSKLSSCYPALQGNFYFLTTLMFHD